jgi:hypothetical protein
MLCAPVTSFMSLMTFHIHLFVHPPIHVRKVVLSLRKVTAAPVILPHIKPRPFPPTQMPASLAWKFYPNPCFCGILRSARKLETARKKKAFSRNPVVQAPPGKTVSVEAVLRNRGWRRGARVLRVNIFCSTCTSDRTFDGTSIRAR